MHPQLTYKNNDFTTSKSPENAAVLCPLSSGKEKDVETGYHYFGARYYNSDLSMWLSVDPMSDKYPSLSPYNYCAWNPIRLVDPDGRTVGDYYDKYGKWIYNDGINDWKIYVEDKENGLFMGPLVQPLFKELGTVSFVELTFIGEATNLKNGKNVDVSLSEGTLAMIQHCDDGNDYVRFSMEATSGQFGNGSLENGSYTVKKGWRRTESGYVQHDVGFCFPIIPCFQTSRSSLLIHPDGNKPGTKGCIGINSDAFGLNDFYKTLNQTIDKFGNIPLIVDIQNNVNNNGSTSNTSNLNE